MGLLIIERILDAEDGIDFSSRSLECFFNFYYFCVIIDTMNTLLKFLGKITLFEKQRNSYKKCKQHVAQMVFQTS